MSKRVENKGIFSHEKLYATDLESFWMILETKRAAVLF